MFRHMFRNAAAVLAVIAGTALLVMMLLTFIDVIGRYGFHNSVFGAAEIIEYLMVIIIFAGLAFITATNDHITVTLFDGWIDRSIPELRRWTVIVFSVGCYGLITWELWRHGLDLWISGKRTPVLDWPQWIQPACGALLSTIGLVLMVAATVQSRGHLESLQERDEENAVGRGVES